MLIEVKINEHNKVKSQVHKCEIWIVEGNIRPDQMPTDFGMAILKFGFWHHNSQDQLGTWYTHAPKVQQHVHWIRSG